MDKAFTNVNEAQGDGLILQAGALQQAEMRLAQGPLGVGLAHLLGILLEEGIPKERTDPRAPRDISCPSTILLRYNHPARCQMKVAKRCRFGPNQHFIHRTSLLMLHPSKGKCKGSWKTLFQSFGEKLTLAFSIHLGRVGAFFPLKSS